MREKNDVLRDLLNEFRKNKKPTIETEEALEKIANYKHSYSTSNDRKLVQWITYCLETSF